jgi:serine/threonine-protein kinase RsbW
MSEKPLKLLLSIPPVEGVEDVVIAAIETLATKMGFTPADTQDIVQALTEACINAIIYSASSHDVEIVALAGHSSLVLEVRDRGSGFDPNSVPPPDFDSIVSNGLPNNGGFGLHMIKALVDSVDIESSDRGTIVRMSKYLKVSTPN